MMMVRTMARSVWQEAFKKHRVGAARFSCNLVQAATRNGMVTNKLTTLQSHAGSLVGAVMMFELWMSDRSNEQNRRKKTTRQRVDVQEKGTFISWASEGDGAFIID